MIITLIQARIKSNRLPGKCLKEIAGRSMTSYVVEAAKKSKLNQLTSLICPIEDKNIFLSLYLNECFIFGGSEEDVLKRYYDSYKHIEKLVNQKIDHIIRLTADCPMLYFYSKIIDEVIERHLMNEADFTHNRGINGFPSGLDVEVMTSETLDYIYEKAINKEDREHVTLYIKRNPEKFKIYDVNSVFNFDCKWSIDTSEDFFKVSDIIKVMRMREKYE